MKLPIFRPPNTQPYYGAMAKSLVESIRVSHLLTIAGLAFFSFVLGFHYALNINNLCNGHYHLETKPIEYLQIKAGFNQSRSALPIVSGGGGNDLTPERTNLSHIVFGIASSSKLWNARKNYVKLWWRPSEMRGAVWMEEIPKSEDSGESSLLPPMRVSEDTSEFEYRHPVGSRSGIRISRIVGEAARMNMTGVRWYVMGDDDTVFVPENLVSVLRKYDHNQFYYIGANSESHVQNIKFSYKMAYGGGGFALSAPLVAELAKMQDRCIRRYPELYGSDDRIHACMAELGVPLTKEPGFHQFDVYGSVFGILAAHPVAPLVTLHHLDLIKPIFPRHDRIGALKKLFGPAGLDSAALAQQSICYDPARNWTVSVSWGYAVQVFRGYLTPRELETAARTFYNWYPSSDHEAHAFNTRPFDKNTCQTPTLFYLTEAETERGMNRTVTRYGLHKDVELACDWNVQRPFQVRTVDVYKTTDPFMWDKAPRRNCCRILQSDAKHLAIDVGACDEGEVAEM